MGIQDILNQAVKKGLSKDVKKKVTSKKEAPSTVVKKKKASSPVVKKRIGGRPQKPPKRKQRALYEEEEKGKRKKAKRVHLTPLIIDEHPPVKKERKEKLSKTGSRRKLSKNSKSTADGGSLYENPITPYLPTEEELNHHITTRAIRGGDAGPVHNPLDDAGLPALDFLKSYTEEKGAQGRNEEELLKQAHDYFSQLNRDEQRRNSVAMKRLKEMKRVNRAGGDKDGFKYVVPKNVSTIVRQLMVAEGMEGAQVDPDTLGSHFGGDGVKETEAKPMRSRKARNNAFDDFYQFQVAKKWTRNAESFLARGRAGKSMFAAKQKQQRSIKRM